MYYRTKNPHGGDIYETKIRLDFSANVNPFGMPEAVKKAARGALEEADRYPDPYCRKLVNAIARAEGLSKEDILIGNGASELIYAYCMAQRSAKAMIAVPSFVDYEESLKKTGSGILYYCIKKENGFALEEGILSCLESERPDVLFLCSPNNPTGRSVSPDLMKEILKTAEKTSCSVFLDECFYELSDRQISFKDELHSRKNLFILRAFTKCYGMAGLRLGYCLCADHELLYRMSLHTLPWSVSHPAQKAGIAALKEKEFLARSVREIRKEREWFRQQLTKEGIMAYPSEANFLFFEGPEDLQERLLQEGVLIRSCANYEGLQPGYFRIAVRTHEENEEFLNTLRSVLT